MGEAARALLIPASGAAVSSARAALLTAGAPWQREMLLLHGTCAAAGMLAAGALGAKLYAGGDARVFGKKTLAAGNPEQQEAVRATETGGVDAQSAGPIRVAQDAAAALAGIKSLIESLQVTDRQTWEKVAGLAGEAETAPEEMRARLAEAEAAAGRATEAFRGIAALVEGR